MTQPPLWLRLTTLPLIPVPYFLLAWYDDLLAGMGSAFYLVVAVAVGLSLVAVVLHRDWFASLRLTVALLALSTLLVFLGTLAQVELGVWDAVELYFRSLYVWVPVDVLRSVLMPGMQRAWPGQFIFPGGFLLLGLLIQNLVAAHTVRYKVRATGKGLGLGVGLLAASVLMFVLTVAVPGLSMAIQQDVVLMLAIWAVPMTLATVAMYVLFGSRKAGVVLVHIGLVLLLAGEFVTGLEADEGQMLIAEHGASNYTYDTREVELALVAALDNGNERHVVVPQRMLEAAVLSGEPIEDPGLPAPVRVDGLLANSDLTASSFVASAPALVDWQAVEVDSNSGTSGATEVDLPSAYIALPGADGTYRRVLVSVHQVVPPAVVEIDGVVWRASLRFKRTYLPYTIQLHDFRNDIFTGSGVAKNYSSDLRLIEPDGSAREAFIKMNRPLRYDGKAFFQSNFFQHPLNRNTGTVMQVAQNPGALLPYMACVVVTVGLCAQFGGSLRRYARRTAAQGIG
ncbi:MAG: cytochrome c biogenesis protein ResB [Phycisphaerales bacterium JB063]